MNTLSTRRGSLPQAIAAELRQRIASGDLKPGERLLSQRKLAADFSVSVGVVREAISMLVSSELIETRVARGTFVVDAARLPALDGAPLERSEAEELFEARKLLELELVGLAAERASRPQIERLRVGVDRMAAVAESASAYLDADVAFHLTLADAAGNRFLRGALEDVWSRLRRDMEISADTAIRRFGSLRFSVASHAQLVDAIEARDDDEAQRITLELVRRSEEFVLGLYALGPAGESGAESGTELSAAVSSAARIASGS